MTMTASTKINVEILTTLDENPKLNSFLGN